MDTVPNERAQNYEVDDVDGDEEEIRPKEKDVFRPVRKGQIGSRHRRVHKLRSSTRRGTSVEVIV